MSNKKTVEKTLAETIYKGSYNFLTDLEMSPSVEFSIAIENNRKVFKQLSGYNSQKTFAEMSVIVKDEVSFAKIVLLKTDKAKENFKHLLAVAKRVFEPKLI